jgi:hypothetical protein
VSKVAPVHCKQNTIYAMEQIRSCRNVPPHREYKLVLFLTWYKIQHGEEQTNAQKNPWSGDLLNSETSRDDNEVVKFGTLFESSKSAGGLCPCEYLQKVSNASQRRYDKSRS